MVTVLSELDACIPDNGSGLDAILESKQIGQALNSFLASQNKQDCAIFLSRYYHCMTINEIADKNRLSERHVKYRLSRMRQQLKKYLEKESIYV